MAIDIGPGAINRSGSPWIDGYTILELTNPANEAGTLSSMEFWFHSNGANVKAGTFHGSGTSWSRRDYETIGSVTSGSKQTFSGLSCDVEINDVIGIYFTGGELERSVTGQGDICRYRDQDHFTDTSVHTYWTYTAIGSTYGAGGVAGWTGKVMGHTDPAKIMGVAVADIKKVMGVE